MSYTPPPPWEAPLHLSLVTLVILFDTVTTLYALNHTPEAPPLTVPHIALPALALIAFHLTHFTAPGSVVDWPHYRPDLAHPGVVCANVPPASWCTPCKTTKPPRVHHCTACNTCILRFDHHCPWTACCIGFGNAKFFLLFLLYCSLAAALSVFTLGRYMAHTPHMRPSIIAAALFVPFALAVSVTATIAVGALFFWNFWLAARNETSLESFRRRIGQDVDSYDVGLLSNLRHLLGWNPFLWLLPLPQKREPPLKTRP